MCRCVWVCERQRGRLSFSSSGKCMQEQHEELLSAACQALTRALTPATLPPSHPPRPFLAGLPSSLLQARRPGEMSNSHSGTGAPRRLALWNGCSLWQINALSFPRALPLSDSQEEKEGEKWVWVERRGRWFLYVFVCVYVWVCREGRVLAGHLMIFAMAALSECCWRKMGNALHKLKRHAILLLPLWEEKVAFPVSPDMRIFSCWTGNFTNMNDISDNHIKMLSCAKMNSISPQWWNSYVWHL